MKHFLKGICGEASNKEKKILSIAQDIISLHSNDKKRMPKKTGLGLVFKRSVRSKELITLLNNLRQSVSYEGILRIDTTWAPRILEANHGHSTIPANIRETFFTQAASDNGDYGQENNSQHVTNTVLYQYLKLSGPYVQNTMPCRTTKTLRLSLDVPSTQQNNLVFMRKPDLPKIDSEINPFQILKYKSKSNARIKFTDLTTAWIL